ncbi:MAG: tetratricopeptide repeat protein [Planctomycetaceae bacterium]|nr:tetratricopeptide repeat protein [Planctomycetaceae bacterium]
MIALRRFLLAAIGFELLAVAILAGRRLNATHVAPPPVAQYNDATAGSELLSLPHRFLFDGPAKWRRLGEAYLVYGYFSKADACLRRGVADDPAAIEVAIAHGFVLERLGQIEEAAEVFRRAALRSKGPLAATAWHHVGRNHLRLEQPDPALQAFERAGDDHFPSVYQRAKWLIREGRALEAQPLLSHLADNFPNDLHVWQLQATAAAQLGQAGQVAAARDALELAVPDLELDDLDSYFKPIRERFGLARGIEAAVRQQHAGKRGLAADLMEQLVHDDPLWENSYLLLLQDAASMQVQAGNFEAAAPLLDRQINAQGFPTAIAWEALADVELSRDREQPAWQALQHAERMLPNPNLHFKMAELAKRLGDDAAYDRHLCRAGLLVSVGLLRSNRLEEARRSLRGVLTLDPNMSDAWYFVGETESRLGQIAQARAAYRRCLTVDPDHGRAQIALDRLTVNQSQTDRN